MKKRKVHVTTVAVAEDQNSFTTMFGWSLPGVERRREMCVRWGEEGDPRGVRVGDEIQDVLRTASRTCGG